MVQQESRLKVADPAANALLAEKDAADDCKGIPVIKIMKVKNGTAGITDIVPVRRKVEKGKRAICMSPVLNHTLRKIEKQYKRRRHSKRFLLRCSAI